MSSKHLAGRTAHLRMVRGTLGTAWYCGSQIWSMRPCPSPCWADQVITTTTGRTQLWIATEECCNLPWFVMKHGKFDPNFHFPIETPRLVKSLVTLLWHCDRNISPRPSLLTKSLNSERLNLNQAENRTEIAIKERPLIDCSSVIRKICSRNNMLWRRHNSQWSAVI